MCFSTEASFTAAAVLAIVGTMTLKITRSHSQLLLAAIPFLFALQQFSEGMIWLYFSQHIGTPSLFLNAQRSFLIFAFLIWPIWIPLALLLIEKINWRRIFLALLLYLGIGLSLLNLFYALHEKVMVRVVYHSLQYQGDVPSQALLYPLIVILPCFISSLKNIWLFGLLVLMGYILAAYYYSQTFVSVWCFFAAIVSLFIYKLLKDNQDLLDKKSP